MAPTVPRPRGARAGGRRRALLLLLPALLLPPRARGSAVPGEASPRPPSPAPFVRAPSLEAEEEYLVGKAKELFDRYVSLEEAFDPAAAELYADTARIRSRRVSATGEERLLSLPAPQFKEILRKSLPIAREGGDRKLYTDTHYVPEGGRVRIYTTRHSLSRDGESPLSLLVGPAGDGTWRILEEYSVTRQAPRPTRPGGSISPAPPPKP